AASFRSPIRCPSPPGASARWSAPRPSCPPRSRCSSSAPACGSRSCSSAACSCGRCASADAAARRGRHARRERRAAAPLHGARVPRRRARRAPPHGPVGVALADLRERRGRPRVGRRPLCRRARPPLRRRSRLAALARNRRRRVRRRGGVRVPAHDRERRGAHHDHRRGSERRDAGGRGILAAGVGRGDPADRARCRPRIARRAPHAHRDAAARAARARATARLHAAAVVAPGRRGALRGLPHPERARGARGVIVPIALLGGGALVAFAVRKQVHLAGPLSAAALAAAIWWTISSPQEKSEVLGLQLRLSPLAQLGGAMLLSSLFILVLAVWLDEPAYNFFPTALAAGAAVTAVLTLTSPIAIYAVLLLALLVPVGSFTFQVTRNRSVEAAYRHFSFVALGGSLGIAALALAGSLPRDQPAGTFVVLIVIVVVAFALNLAAIPFHTHAALLATEVPAPALALYFGVLVPTTFIAFAEILTLSGLLPAIVQISKVQDLLLGLGTVSALGGAFLATGSTELRRVAAYSVIANLGQALVGIATLSGPGIVAMPTS